VPRGWIEHPTPCSSKRVGLYHHPQIAPRGQALPIALTAKVLPYGIVSTPSPTYVGAWLGIVLRLSKGFPRIHLICNIHYWMRARRFQACALPLSYRGKFLKCFPIINKNGCFCNMLTRYLGRAFNAILFLWKHAYYAVRNSKITKEKEENAADHATQRSGGSAQKQLQ